MRNLIKIIFTCSIIAFFLVQIVGASTSSAWWNSSWAYKKPVEVNTPYNYTDYQLKLNLTDKVNATTGAVGIWRFLEGSGTNTADASGNYNDGTLVNGPVWTSEGLEFDGVDDYVRISTLGEDDVGGAAGSRTVSYWFSSNNDIYAGSLPGYQYMANWGGNPSASGVNPFGYVVPSSGKIGAYLYSTAGDFPDVKTVKSSWNANTWYFLLFTYNSSSNNLSVYVDGTLDNYDVGTGTPNMPQTNFYLGGSVSYNKNYFNGTISDVRIYDRVLTESQINKTYCEGAYRLNKTSTFTYPSWCNDYLDTNIKKSYALYYRDVRFTDKNGEDELSYYRDLHHENIFYVKGNFTNENGTQMYMYYGNDNVNTTSSYYDTFHENNNSIVLDLPMKYQLGTNVWDVSEQGNNGTIYNGAVWVDGGGLNFDGNDDRVTLNNEPPYRCTSGVCSFSLWVKINEPSGNIFMKSNSYVDLDAEGYQMPFTASQKIALSTWNNNNNQYIETTTSSWTAGQWYHIVGIFGSSGQYLYVNGVLEASNSGNTQSPGFENNNLKPLTFGAKWRAIYSRWEAFFNGTISDVRVYNTSLSATDIQLLYNETQYPPTYSIGEEQKRTSYLKLTTDKTNYQLGEVVHLTIEINRTEKFPQIASFKLELIEPADNPDIILESKPFTMPAIFYKNVTLSYTIPNSPFMQSGLYGFKATLTEPTLGTVLASDETFFYINDTITPTVQGII